MEVEGMIIRDLGAIEGVSKAGNPWKKHEWVLETLGQFPRKVKFTVFGERSSTLNFELGKNYAIQFDIDSREFNERWYTDIMVYGARPIEPGQTQFGATPAPAPAPSNPYNQTPQFGPQTAPAQNPFGTGPTPDFTQSDSQEDLPF